MEDLTEILGTISESDPENIDKEEQQIKNKGSDANSGASVVQGNGFWKLNESLLQQKKYTELIRNFWKSWGKEKLKMNILDWWEKEKKSIKDITINYSKVMATKEKYKYKGLIQQLEEEEHKNENDISNERINKIKKEIEILEDNRKKGVIIRSREEYYNGDLENIEIFELAEEERGIKKEIRELYDKNGILRENKEEIINIVRDFYKGLYSSQNIENERITDFLEGVKLNKLEEADWVHLNPIMTNEECFKNTKDFQNNKTPGIDGLGKAFYVEFWDIIGEDLTEVINNIYLTGEMTELELLLSATRIKEILEI
ncbi:unnamed protein product [Mytilus coruscus]|uniref:Reverse transcriptase domain-containing protein n=1 Tax=Mytilus coruscus TaxID=42192 RepID=A0A6J8BNI1_MYTCO|nr:unnamed protein product [Mytilus coruscus]